jgi:hypothetical protein
VPRGALLVGGRWPAPFTMISRPGSACGPMAAPVPCADFHESPPRSRLALEPQDAARTARRRPRPVPPNAGSRARGVLPDPARDLVNEAG